MKRKAKLKIVKIAGSVIFVVLSLNLGAKDRMLVWSDEFDGTTIDQSFWSFEVGPTYETLHYFTDRSDNARIENGILKIIALEESYEGYDYTAALLKTNGSLSYLYGRIEARMKLPHTTGFVPGFWMLPENEIYGWWPWSGEIDIMEHPTNQDKIFGTCHTFQYSYFTGSGAPSGGNIQITDSETAFHVYAVEWTPDKIDFFVDDQKYFTHLNDYSGFEIWPFDQPFYLLLAQGVGGGWVGDPDASTVFPGVLEVDYVRVYQYSEDIALNGPDFLLPNTVNTKYYAPENLGFGYDWSTPNQANISSGQNSHEIVVDWGLFGGTVELDDGIVMRKYPVIISDNILKNGSFEKGVKYWNKSAYPAEADFIWTSDDAQQGEKSVFVDVKTASANIWDAQLSQSGIDLQAGKHYYVSFWGKAISGSGFVSAGVINSTNYAVYGSSDVYLTNEWTRYEFDFTAPSSSAGSFNISVGDHTGSYYFDDIQLKLPEAENINQVVNASFSEGDEGWIFNSYNQEEASMEVVDGESNISITTGGINPWDIHLGQVGAKIYQGKEYTFSFDAYASAPREISAFIGLNASPWTVYSGENNFILLNSRQTFSFTFIMESPSDENARFGFDLGGFQENVNIDNVFLSTDDNLSTAGQQLFIPSSKEIISNFPNPFSQYTAINYELIEEGYIKLQIFSNKGQLVETLIDTYSIPGVYKVQWNGGMHPPGVYYMNLLTPLSSTTEKIVLIK